MEKVMKTANKIVSSTNFVRDFAGRYIIKKVWVCCDHAGNMKLSKLSCSDPYRCVKYLLSKSKKLEENFKIISKYIEYKDDSKFLFSIVSTPENTFKLYLLSGKLFVENEDLFSYDYLQEKYFECYGKQRESILINRFFRTQPITFKAFFLNFDEEKDKILYSILNKFE